MYHFVFWITEGLIGLLEHRREQASAYIGCMKSGEVVTEEYISYRIYLYSAIVAYIV